MGITLFITSFIGGITSKHVENKHLLLIFAIMALIAAGLIILPKKTEAESPDIIEFSFSRFRAVVVSVTVGYFGGLVGQGGSFILIPLMTVYVKVPIRIAIGSNLAIVFLATFAAFLGKAITSQIEWGLTLPIILTVIPAAFLGANISRKIPVTTLRMILGTSIALAAVRIGFAALS